MASTTLIFLSSASILANQLILDGNNKYNLRNSVIISEKEVFHIHGDLRRAQSICLGYEHYAGTVQHLREAIATKKDVGGEIKCLTKQIKSENL